MHRHVFAAAGFFLLTLAAAAQTPPPPPANGAVAGAKLPPGEGRDLVMRTCSKCHDPSQSQRSRIWMAPAGRIW